MLARAEARPSGPRVVTAGIGRYRYHGSGRHQGACFARRGRLARQNSNFWDSYSNGFRRGLLSPVPQRYQSFPFWNIR